MFGRIRAYCRRRFGVLIANEIAGWERECKAVMAERDLWKKTADEGRNHFVKHREMLATQSHLREQAENEVERLSVELKNQLEEYGSLMEQLNSADAAAQTLREELAAERADLAEVRHELERTGKQLELASQENRLLSEIHETDFQRRRKEKELEITQGELAIAEARKYTTEQHFEAE